MGRQVLTGKRGPLHSFVPPILFIIVSVTIIIYSVLGLFAVYSIDVTKENITEASVNVMNVCIDNMEYARQSAYTELITLLYNYNTIVRLSSSDASTRYFSQIKLADIMEERVFLNRYIDSMLVMNTTHNIHIFRSNSNKNLYNSRAFIRCTEDMIITGDASEYSWNFVTVVSGDYYVYYFKIDETYIFGFLNADFLFQPIRETGTAGANNFILLDDTNKPLMSYYGIDSEELYFSSNGDMNIFTPYYYEEVSIPSLNAKLRCIMQTSTILQSCKIQILFILLAFLLSLGLILFIVIFFKREIIKPIKGLTMMAQHVRSGDLDYRTSVSCHSREFIQIQDSFNYTVEELLCLRMDYYEEQIAFRDMEFKYFHMQIRPHFFLNIFTTVYSMSLNGRYKEMRSFIESLYDVIRYMFKTGLHTVPLRDEINHLRQYINMQSKLYKNSVIPYFDVDTALDDWPVPQMIIHTFVENTYKHTVSPDSTILLFIQVKPMEYDGMKYAHIVVEDTGVGFPPELLEELSGYRDSTSDQGVGLKNIQSTLRLLYGRDGLVKFSNVSPHGARIDITIPNETVIREGVKRRKT